MHRGLAAACPGAPSARRPRARPDGRRRSRLARPDLAAGLPGTGTNPLPEGRIRPGPGRPEPGGAARPAAGGRVPGPGRLLLGALRRPGRARRLRADPDSLAPRGSRLAWPRPGEVGP